MRSINRLNEEIARWAFEILFKDRNDWVITFTNPTAGPWKTIKASDIHGEMGEVYRFALKENRPDIVMYNDALRTVMIIEAKDDIDKLIAGDQAEKSAEVVNDLAVKLRTLSENPYWSMRTDYSIVLGILWGSNDEPASNRSKERVYDKYQSLITRDGSVSSDLVVGIESLYARRSITCSAFYKTYSADASRLASQIVETLL